MWEKQCLYSSSGKELIYQKQSENSVEPEIHIKTLLLSHEYAYFCIVLMQISDLSCVGPVTTQAITGNHNSVSQ